VGVIPTPEDDEMFMDLCHLPVAAAGLEALVKHDIRHAISPRGIRIDVQAGPAASRGRK
jgi:hypothetical protein